MTPVPDSSAEKIHDLALAIVTERNPVRVWPLLMERLTADLPCDLAVLIDLDWDAGTGHALTGSPDWLHEAPLDALIHAHMRSHPLLRHYARTRDTTPLTMDEVADDRWWKGEAYRAGKDAIGIDRQLALPLAAGPGQIRGVIMSRGGHGFSDRDLEYAALARSLLDAVEAHETAAFVRRGPGDPTDYRLTPRELAVLGLLCEGLTARAIGTRLGIAPATATKHTENLYRKLGVHDRVAALRAAQQLGLIAGPGPAETATRFRPRISGSGAV
ncbi:helix-turn-helix transcriptional regulator [Nocardia gipuzkoensis]|uniref:helix-turn-helix transcriptional regulator n=1 Tax=Nocardia gipuzkoensis TaxID=2749991 RepID=UPI00237EAC75|nr:LuxR C-terminal-related transcriptional regulator [Nocardia gipuzkoensis]MDE1669635.1 LuxR C-terminal-related transcriptional regulator [Nocardia gipuzkoensis]